MSEVKDYTEQRLSFFVYYQEDLSEMNRCYVPKRVPFCRHSNAVVPSCDRRGLLKGGSNAEIRDRKTDPAPLGKQ